MELATQVGNGLVLGYSSIKSEHKKSPDIFISGLFESGGEEEIRTLDKVSPIHTFQACSFNHSDTSPDLNGGVPC